MALRLTVSLALLTVPKTTRPGTSVMPEAPRPTPDRLDRSHRFEPHRLGDGAQRSGTVEVAREDVY